MSIKLKLPIKGRKYRKFDLLFPVHEMLFMLLYNFRVSKFLSNIIRLRKSCSFTNDDDFDDACCRLFTLN